MLEWLGKWITSLTAVSILTGCADALAQGTAKKAVRFAGGLVLVVVLLSPLRTADIGDMSFYVQQYRAEYEGYAEKHINSDSPQIRLIIEDKTNAYILQKAGSLGVNCSVSTTAKGSENGYPYPSSLNGTYAAGTDPESLESLKDLVEADLCIPREKQIWNEG